MKITFKTPLELGIKGYTKTKWIAVIFEDDDFEEKYPVYQVIPESVTKEVAYQQILEENNKDFVFVVFKNADFTEGRGPLVLDKIFKNRVPAEKYIENQVGIYGSKQYREFRTGININKGVYCYISHNGYSIEKAPIQKYLSSEFIEKQSLCS